MDLGELSEPQLGPHPANREQQDQYPLAKALGNSANQDKFNYSLQESAGMQAMYNYVHANETASLVAVNYKIAASLLF